MTAKNKKMNLSHFTLKQLIELEACTKCGECIRWCPTYVEEELEEITPLSKISRYKNFIKGQYGGWLARLFGIRPPSEDDVAAFGEGTFKCTLCARCQVVCPIQIDTRALWIAMRQQLVDWGEYPEIFNTMQETITSSYNISGDENATRLIWSENLAKVPEGIAGKAGAETVYFTGCVGAFYPMVYGVPQSFVQILEALGLDFTTLGGEEWCCGFPLVIAGMGKWTAELVRHNVEAVRAIGAKRLVATCPSCYHTWKHDYPAMLGEPLGFEVLHATELLAELIEAGKIEWRGFRHPVTYHDPCDLGRTSGVYEAPRQIIQAIPGIEFTEMADNRQYSLCCGGGGDAEMGSPDLTAAVARRRLEQAQATGAKVIVSACQQCKRTLAGAARKEKIRLKVYDITELVWEAMGE